MFRRPDLSPDDLRYFVSGAVQAAADAGGSEMMAGRLFG
jgi:hypothetical protein